MHIIHCLLTALFLAAVIGVAAQLGDVAVAGTVGLDQAAATWQPQQAADQLGDVVTDGLDQAAAAASAIWQPQQAWSAEQQAVQTTSTTTSAVVGGMAVMFGRPDWQIGFSSSTPTASACTQQIERIAARMGVQTSRARCVLGGGGEQGVATLRLA